VALSCSASRSAEAFTLFGTSRELSPGPVDQLPATLFGEQLAPRLDLDGFIGVQSVAYRQDGVDHAETAVMMNLDVDLKLTATQRVHVLFQPLESGTRKPTKYTFLPDDESGWDVQTQAVPARAWYEGQPFNWLSPNDRVPLDVTVAGGRMPLFFHNGLWFDNTFDGFALSKNNLEIGNAANVNVLYFLTRGQTLGGVTPEQERETQKNVMGAVLTADWLGYFLEASWAWSYDNPSDLVRNFWGLSATRQLGSVGLSLRVLGSTGNSASGAGELGVLEVEKIFPKARLYTNLVGGTANWLPVSVEGAPLSREGILFTFDRLVPFPSLNPTGQDTFGGVIGVVWNAGGIYTVTPEIGGLVDEHHHGNDQIGVAVQFQADLASLIIPGSTVAETQRRGLLYGALLRLTVLDIRNEGDAFAGSRNDYGGRLELVYRF
jgi:hypothetical protein